MPGIDKPVRPNIHCAAIIEHDELVTAIDQAHYKDPAPFIIELLKKFDDKRVNKTVADYLASIVYPDSKTTYNEEYNRCD